MALKQRLRTLEKRSGMRGPCPLCGGKGKLVMRVGTRDEIDAQGEPNGCPHCGESFVVNIVRFDRVVAGDAP